MTDWTHSDLRKSIYDKVFEHWHEEGKISIVHGLRCNHLWWLLRGDVVPAGRDHGYFVYTDQLTDSELAICNALKGPHGWSVYKMLLARREGQNDNDNVNP